MEIDRKWPEGLCRIKQEEGYIWITTPDGTPIYGQQGVTIRQGAEDNEWENDERTRGIAFVTLNIICQIDNESNP